MGATAWKAKDAAWLKKHRITHLGGSNAIPGYTMLLWDCTIVQSDEIRQHSLFLLMTTQLHNYSKFHHVNHSWSWSKDCPWQQRHLVSVAEEIGRKIGRKHSGKQSEISLLKRTPQYPQSNILWSNVFSKEFLYLYESVCCFVCRKAKAGSRAPGVSS